MSTTLLFVIAFVNVVSSQQCYWDSTPYKYFGGKTLYDDVRGDIRHVEKLQGCEPISIWLLSRHGARNPGEVNIKSMKEAMRLKEDVLKSHDQGRGELCDQDIASLETWKWNDTIDSTPYYLTSRGYREQTELGNRINETFYSLLKDLHVNYIRTTKEQRTAESAKAFHSGLDSKLGYSIQDPLEKNKDFVLLPYKNCERQEKEAWNGPRRQEELQKYYETEEYKMMMNNLQKRMGLLEPVSISNISGLYDLCRFYRSFSDTARTPWCSLFSSEDLEVLEYLEDIRHYFRSGYGIPINKKLGELVLKDLLEKFQRAIYDSQPSFTAYFSHDSLMDMVYSALGLFHDGEGISGERRDPHRKWRTSVNTPFSANFLAVLENCTEPSSSSPYRVQFFINEKPLNLCEDVCSWSAFEDKFKPFTNSSLSFCEIKSD